MASERLRMRMPLEALLVAVLFALFARTFVVQVFKIPTGSMAPMLWSGDHVLVNKFLFGSTVYPWEERFLPLRPVRRGDVVVFKYPRDPRRDMVKRCVGLAGDTLEMVDKALSVNGEEDDESAYAVHADPLVYPRSLYLREGYRNRDNFGPLTVAEGYSFCLGDNRDESNDSRFWGQVPDLYLKGRALLVLWALPVPPPEPTDDAEAEAMHDWTRGRRWLRLVR